MFALLLSVALCGNAGNDLPLVDISGETSRQVVIAHGTDRVYQGHPTTVLMPDGKTIYCVWTIGHGGPCGPMAKSLDGGLTWHSVEAPKDWRSTEDCPSIYLLQGLDRIQRLMIFAARPNMSQTFSEDGGKTWSRVRSLGMPCVMAFCSVTRLSNGDYLGLYHRGRNDLDVAPLTIWQSISKDGGLTWGKPTIAGELAGRSPCEPEVIRSPNGRQLLCLMRENQRVGHSLMMVSNDEGKSWSKPTETPWGLTGDRHKARYALDGRLVVCFRDMAPRSPSQGSFVAWVGTYQDILEGKPGQYRIEILHQHGDGGWSRFDCGYPGLEVLPEGTFVATTYVKYRPGPEKNSVVSVRFRLDETDAAGRFSADPREASRLQSLDGQWRMTLDPKDTGKTQGWFKADAFPASVSRPIQVPGNILEVEPNYTGVFWYAHDFTSSMPSSAGLRHYLRFGAVGYACEVWLNGARLGGHEGGQSPFEFDVTGDLLAQKPNRLAVRVSGPYIAVMGGISQHVSLVARPNVRIKDVFAQSDIQTRRIQLQVAFENDSPAPAAIVLRATCGQFRPPKNLHALSLEKIAPRGPSLATLTIPVTEPHLWSVDDPFLYTIRVTTDWPAAGSPVARHDSHVFRTGFRDFRIVDGYFHLNGKRIYLKSAHSNWYDPISIYGTPRNMKYVGQDFALLKRAGFNMFRFIVSAAMPEQLDLADEVGMVVYSEHETSWLHKETTKFGISLNDVVRRDRNHPSLVIWGLLNETPPGPIYQSARGWLPSLREIDATRLVLLNSGRWDTDFKTGSASNPGSAAWNVYLGGEDPVQPGPTGELPTELGGYRNGTGDAHVYQRYPTTWSFISSFSITP